MMKVGMREDVVEIAAITEQRPEGGGVVVLVAIFQGWGARFENGPEKKSIVAVDCDVGPNFDFCVRLGLKMGDPIPMCLFWWHRWQRMGRVETNRRRWNSGSTHLMKTNDSWFLKYLKMNQLL